MSFIEDRYEVTFQNIEVLLQETAGENHDPATDRIRKVLKYICVRKRNVLTFLEIMGKALIDAYIVARECILADLTVRRKQRKEWR